MKHLDCLELLKKLGITPVDSGIERFSENLIFWHDGFCDLICIPCSVIDQYDQSQDTEIFRILTDYSFRRGFTIAKLQHTRGLCTQSNPYIQANNLTPQ